MKGQRELALFLSLAVFLGSPYVPDRILKATVNTYVGVAALLLVVLYAVRQDMVVALAVFLAAGALFLENRKRLVAGGGTGPGPNGQKEGPIVSEPASVASLSVPAPEVQEGEVHPEFERPERDSHDFEPTEDTGSNDFRAVGHSINDKQPLASAPNGEAAAEVFERAGL